MAFTVEEISKSLAGDGEITDLIKQAAERIVSMHDEDVRGLKGTNADLKKEKTELKNRYDADLELFAQKEKDFHAQIEAARTANAGSSEEQKQYYDTQLAHEKEAFAAQIALKEKLLSEREAQLKDLMHREEIRCQEAEFLKEVQKTKADPIMYDVLQNMVLGQGNNFAAHDTPEGKVYWATDNSGETMKNRLEKILSSDKGKHFVMFNSTGAGAEGSLGGSGYSGENPFITGNATQQAMLYRQDPKLYAELERQAKAKGY